MCVCVDSHNASQGKDLKDKVTGAQLNDKGVSVDSLNACQGRDLKDKACADDCTLNACPVTQPDVLDEAADVRILGSGARGIPDK